MEGRRNELYARASRLRDGGWAQFEAVTPQNTFQEPAPLPGQLPAMEPPASAEIPAPMAIPMPVEMQEPAAMPGPAILFELDTEGAPGSCLTPAIAHVPVQKWGRLYEPEMGLERGTIFPELDLPFLGGECNYE